MPNQPRLSERLETGDIVKNDQTVTIRVYHAKRKVRGRLLSPCPRGCGAYLTDDEKLSHQCPPEPASTTPINKWRSKAIAREIRRQTSKTSPPQKPRAPKGSPPKRKYRPAPIPSKAPAPAATKSESNSLKAPDSADTISPVEKLRKALGL